MKEWKIGTSELMKKQTDSWIGIDAWKREVGMWLTAVETYALHCSYSWLTAADQ